MKYLQLTDESEECLLLKALCLVEIQYFLSVEAQNPTKTKFEQGFKFETQTITGMINLKMERQNFAYFVTPSEKGKAQCQRGWNDLIYHRRIVAFRLQIRRRRLARWPRLACLSLTVFNCLVAGGDGKLMAILLDNILLGMIGESLIKFNVPGADFARDCVGGRFAPRRDSPAFRRTTGLAEKIDLFNLLLRPGFVRDQASLNARASELRWSRFQTRRSAARDRTNQSLTDYRKSNKWLRLLYFGARSGRGWTLFFDSAAIGLRVSQGAPLTVDDYFGTVVGKMGRTKLGAKMVAKIVSVKMMTFFSFGLLVSDSIWSEFCHHFAFGTGWWLFFRPTSCL